MAEAVLNLNSGERLTNVSFSRVTTLKSPLRAVGDRTSVVGGIAHQKVIVAGGGVAVVVIIESQRVVDSRSIGAGQNAGVGLFDISFGGSAVGTPMVVAA